MDRVTWGQKPKENPKTDMETVVFTKMTLPDLDAVIALEQEAFSSPWTRGMFHMELMDNLFSSSWVMMCRQEIVGYFVYWEVVNEFHLMNFAIARKSWRRGIGTMGMQWIQAQGREKGIARIILEVRASNVSAQAFYKKCDFHQVGIRKRYYDAPVEDALLLQYDFPIPKQDVAPS